MAKKYVGLEGLIELASATDILGLRGFSDIDQNGNYKIILTIKDAHGTNRFERTLTSILSHDKSYASDKILNIARIFKSILSTNFPELYATLTVYKNRLGDEYKFVDSNGGYVKVKFKPAKRGIPTFHRATGDSIIIEGKNASPELTVAVIYSLYSIDQNAAKTIGAYIKRTRQYYLSYGSPTYHYFDKI